jgi:putative DNA primase/helicase
VARSDDRRQSNSDRSNLLKAAEAYAAAGIRVLPLHTVREDGTCTCGDRRCRNVGKHPVAHLAPNGLKNATVDVSTLRSWWAKSDWNIGAVPGPDFVVLDVDPRKPGELGRVAQVIDRHGDFRDTLRMATGRYTVEGNVLRGHHYWFRVPRDIEIRGNKAAGIDLRGTGGYVVMPPSRHASGVNYEVEQGSLATVADAPRWIVDHATRGAQNEGTVCETGDVTGEPLGARTQQADLQGYLPAPEDGETQRTVAVGLIRNWKANGNSEQSAVLFLRRLLADERSSLDPTNPWFPKDADPIVRSVYRGVAPDHDAYVRNGKGTTSRVTLRSYDTIERKTARWLWQDRIPLGNVTMLVGDPGLGKSQLTARLAQMVTSKGGTVILASAEDSPSYTIVPRLQAAGAVLSKVHHVALADEHDTEGAIRLPDDLQELRVQIDRVGGIDLLVVDPVMAHLGGKVDSYKDSDVRKALAPLAQLASDYDCAVVAVAHLNKSTGTNATYRVGGSIAFAAAARSVLLLARDPDSDERGPERILANVKNNLAPEAASLRCTIEAQLLDAVVEEGHVRQPLATTSKIVVGEECGVSGSMLLAASSGEQNGEPKTAVDEAKQFLLAMLAAGPVLSKELLREAKSAGMSEMTVRRAKDALSIKARQVSGKQHGGWVWELPGDDSDDHDDERLTTNASRDRETNRPSHTDDTGAREGPDDPSSVQGRASDQETGSTQDGGGDA